jgi:peptidoglycan/xylan/chitin deacetylase (PgdA/CDA1 family)
VRPARRGWRRAVAALGAVLLFAAAVILTQPLWAFRVLGSVFPRIVWRVDTRQPLVAFTFDDGPSPENTPRVLEILARHGAHATFFLIGERARAHPDVVTALREAGHEVGNHAESIRSTVRLSDREFLGNVLRTEETLRLGGPVKLFRPPGGKIRAEQIALLERRGYRCILGSAYPYDGGHPPPAYIQWIVTKNLAPGTIVILHDGIPDPSRMIEVLDGMLTAADRKGLKVVPVGELLRAGESVMVAHP